MYCLLALNTLYRLPARDRGCGELAVRVYAHVHIFIFCSFIMFIFMILADV